MKILPSVDYDRNQQSGNASLFAIWESGRPSTIPAPLSVRRPRYRRLIVELIKRFAPKPSAELLSIGAGNGFTEADLSRVGFDVLATDRSAIALEYCSAKGLRTARVDFPEQPAGKLPRFDVIYCDGVLGHLWRADAGYHPCWSGFAAFGKKHSILVLSNDLADSDDAPTLRVRNVPHARFFRPPAGWFAQDAQDSKLWKLESTRILHYRRSGLRRREIIILRSLLMHEREKQNHPANV